MSRWRERDRPPRGNRAESADLEKEMTLEECCVYVKHKLNLGSLKVFGDMD